MQHADGNRPATLEERRQSAAATEAQQQQRLAARREANRQRAAGRRQLRCKQQAVAADALQQQVDEYLASFDPGEPLYQDGWAMAEMQENFQHKLRSMRNLCCVVCSERWYTDGECLDPALYVRVNIPFSKTTKKKQGDLNSLLEDYKTFLLGHCVTVPVPHDLTHF